MSSAWATWDLEKLWRENVGRLGEANSLSLRSLWCGLWVVSGLVIYLRGQVHRSQQLFCAHPCVGWAVSSATLCWLVPIQLKIPPHLKPCFSLTFLSLWSWWNKQGRAWAGVEGSTQGLLRTSGRAPWVVWEVSIQRSVCWQWSVKAEGCGFCVKPHVRLKDVWVDSFPVTL